MVQRGHVTQLTAAWLSGQKQPDEELGLGVDQRPDSWRLVIRTGDVGVTASCGPDPKTMSSERSWSAFSRTPGSKPR